jgi:hypothetical protein
LHSSIQGRGGICIRPSKAEVEFASVHPRPRWNLHPSIQGRGGICIRPFKAEMEFASVNPRPRWNLHPSIQGRGGICICPSICCWWDTFLFTEIKKIAETKRRQITTAKACLNKLSLKILLDRITIQFFLS